MSCFVGFFHSFIINICRHLFVPTCEQFTWCSFFCSRLFTRSPIPFQCTTFYLIRVYNISSSFKGLQPMRSCAFSQTSKLRIREKYTEIWIIMKCVWSPIYFELNTRILWWRTNFVVCFVEIFFISMDCIVIRGCDRNFIHINMIQTE